MSTKRIYSPEQIARISETRKAWRLRNPDKVKEYYRKNLAWRKQWRKDHPEEYKAETKRDCIKYAKHRKDWMIKNRAHHRTLVNKSAKENRKKITAAVLLRLKNDPIAKWANDLRSCFYRYSKTINCHVKSVKKYGYTSAELSEHLNKCAVANGVIGVRSIEHIIPLSAFAQFKGTILPPYITCDLLNIDCISRSANSSRYNNISDSAVTTALVLEWKYPVELCGLHNFLIQLQKTQPQRHISA